MFSIASTIASTTPDYTPEVNWTSATILFIFRRYLYRVTDLIRKLI